MFDRIALGVSALFYCLATNSMTAPASGGIGEGVRLGPYSWGVQESGPNV
jgi:hypothetical protein